ncbi:phage head closure protein [Pusillimonas sp. ANT_WB101]|uniref:phage head closure protein n=1 Tax=Pusillimonas sp. ANT_WB101 TaxID=2597356 RepID=UPI0011EFC34B|nr:phage head closure protein [Pusillimonas sp. ANT_WB101]KAA0893075.1 head-tail adaptor protein [Pusillimonas sp. ANT_WB101]
MQAGKLKHRIEIQKQERTPDGGGGWALAWVPVATVWAHVEGLSGREYLQAMAVASTVTSRVFIRYRTDIKPAYRIVHGADELNIRAVLATNDKTYLTLMCDTGPT